MHNVYIFVTHGLFVKDDSLKKGAQLHPIHPHVKSINNYFFKKTDFLSRQHKTSKSVTPLVSNL